MPWGPESSPVAKIKSEEMVVSKISGGCKDSSLPEFWLDLCPSSVGDEKNDSSNEPVEYVDLTEFSMSNLN